MQRAHFALAHLVARAEPIKPFGANIRATRHRARLLIASRLARRNPTNRNAACSA